MSLHIINFFKGLVSANASGKLAASFAKLDSIATDVLDVLPDGASKTLALSSLQTAANVLQAAQAGAASAPVESTAPVVAPIESMPPVVAPVATPAA